MIFLTVGTQLPFDRLVAAVDAWAAEYPKTQIFGQIAEPGPDGYRPRHFPWVAHLDPAAFKTRFEAADQIIAHAGMGTIISALTAGKPLMIMPRRAHLDEHRNDHQQATVQYYGTRPGIHAVFEAQEVHARLENFTQMQGTAEHIGPYADPQLTDTLRKLILS